MDVGGWAGRLRTSYERRGGWATVAEAALRARHSVWPHEAHVWYRLDLRQRCAQQSLPAGLVLQRGGPEELWALRQFESIGEADARGRLERGATWYLVQDERGTPYFSCWLLRREAPVLAVRGGELVVPADMVVLEDSVTAAAARGKGVAPAAWSQIAADAGGAEAMVTKVAVENTASRRAVTKAGFVPFAVVGFRRRTLARRTTVAPVGDNDQRLADWLTLALPGERAEAVTASYLRIDQAPSTVQCPRGRSTGGDGSSRRSERPRRAGGTMGR